MTSDLDDLTEELLKDPEFRKEYKKLQGKWIFHKDFNESCRYGCNQCGNLNNIPSNFCPNCGARMAKE